MATDRSPVALIMRVYDLLIWSSTRTYELHISAMALAAGASVVWPLVDIASAPPWQPLVTMVGGDSRRIGIVLLALGVYAFAAILEDSLAHRRWAQFALCLAWVACSASAVVSGYPGLAAPVYGLMALSCAWTSIRLGVIRA